MCYCGSGRAKEINDAVASVLLFFVMRGMYDFGIAKDTVLGKAVGNVSIHADAGLSPCLR